MRFTCNICGNTKDIYKIKLSYVTGHGLVCKDAMCCDTYMEQEITKEYEGIPKLKRTEPSLGKGDRLWNDFKYNNCE